MNRIFIYLIFFALGISTSGYSQEEALTNLVHKLQHHQQNTLQEKVFVHLDRTFYVGGETMWFKVYVQDGYFHHSLDISKVVYVEILDRDQKPVVQTKISLEHGRGNGAVVIPASLESDNYTVRAYTNWMKNFNADFYFHQLISIVNVFQRLEEKNKNPDRGIDAQFFPEGGHLVDGISSNVAFRVIDSSGQGIPFTGSILSKQGDTLVTFSPLKFGMGQFKFTPEINEEYRVVLKEINGRITKTTLPRIQSQGYVLSVTDTIQNQLNVTITSKDRNENSPFYLIVHNREIVRTATAQHFINGKASLSLPKNELGDGIIHLTIFNQNQQPVCERLYFNRPTVKMSLQIATDKTLYDVRDKITLLVALKSDQPQLVNSSLSIFKSDALQQIQPTNIQSYLSLTSELKGNIESPEYYFSTEKEVNQAMENLMLTHGWSKFRWEEVLQSATKTADYIPEFRGHIIRGKLLDVNTSKPVQGLRVYLGTPDKKILTYISHSNKTGQVLFETDLLIESRKLILQTGNAFNNTRIEIESPFSQDVTTENIPYLKLSEHLKESLLQRSISMQAEDIFYRGRLTNNSQAGDSSAFYGNASERYRLDDYTRFPIMEEVLREYVKGVRVRKKEDHFILRVVDARRVDVFQNDPLILLDGVAIFDVDKIMEMDPLKIKSIDLMTSRYYLGEFYFEGIICLKTYQSDLGGFQFDPGTIILDYEGLQQKKEFYTPRYETTADKLSRLPDQRNLLYWQADLNLNNTQQSIDFYSSDQTGVFQAIIQGISRQGQPVYQTCTFEVKPIHH